MDTIRVPASMLKSELEAWCKAYEDKIGHPPKRADKSAEKELILKRLRKRAFVATQTYDLSWNLDTDAVQIWASSKKIVEEMQIAIEEAFDVSLTPTSPGARADAAEIDGDTIRPTAALFGDDVASEVKSDG